MARTTAVHPVIETARLRLRMFRIDDVDRLHEAMADAAVMRFWETPAHGRRIETERVEQRSLKSAPEYWRVWAVADAADDGCVGMVNDHDGHVRHRRAKSGGTRCCMGGWRGEGVIPSLVE